MAEIFTNNAKATLLTALDAAYVEPCTAQIQFDVNGDGDPIGTFAYSLSRTNYQTATLSNPSMPGVYEIVRIVGISSGGTSTSRVIEVVRARDNTNAKDWPTGSVIEARVTASMLEAFVQSDQDGVINTPGRKAVFNGRVMDGELGIVQIAGYAVLQLIRAKPSSSGPTTSPDDNFSHETVCSTRVFQLGDVPEWVADQYYVGHANVVRPATPDGYQYLFEATNGSSSSKSSTAPAFSASGYATDAINDTGASTEIVGLWISSAMPIVSIQNLRFKMVISEVGFICMDYGDADGIGGVVPKVSIGTDEDPTRFVSDMPLSDITASGHVHRFPITGGGALVGQLKITQTLAATHKFLGRFYWRGFFVEL